MYPTPQYVWNSASASQALSQTGACPTSADPRYLSPPPQPEMMDSYSNYPSLTRQTQNVPYKFNGCFNTPCISPMPSSSVPSVTSSMPYAQTSYYEQSDPANQRKWTSFDEMNSQATPDLLGMAPVDRSVFPRLNLEQTDAFNFYNNVERMNNRFTNLGSFVQRPQSLANGMANPTSGFLEQAQNLPPASTSACWDQLLEIQSLIRSRAEQQLGQVKPMKQTIGGPGSDPSVNNLFNAPNVCESKGSNSAVQPNISSQPNVAPDIANTSDRAPNAGSSSSAAPAKASKFCTLLESMVDKYGILDYICYELKDQDYEFMLNKWKADPSRLELTEDDMCPSLKKLATCQQSVKQNRFPMTANVMGDDIIVDQLGRLRDRLMDDYESRFSANVFSHSKKLAKVGLVLKSMPSKEAVEKLTSDQLKAEMEKLKKTIELDGKTTEKVKDAAWWKKQLLKLAFLMKNLSGDKLFGKDCSAQKAKYDFFQQFIVDGLVALAKQSS